jgi:hypothetical protein
LQVIVRKHVEWTGSPDFEAAPSSYEEKSTASTAADF